MLEWMIGLAALLSALVIFCCARAATLADRNMRQMMESRKEKKEGQGYG